MHLTRMAWMLFPMMWLTFGGHQSVSMASVSLSIKKKLIIPIQWKNYYEDDMIVDTMFLKT